MPDFGHKLEFPFRHKRPHQFGVGALQCRAHDGGWTCGEVAMIVVHVDQVHIGVGLGPETKPANGSTIVATLAANWSASGCRYVLNISMTSNAVSLIPWGTRCAAVATRSISGGIERRGAPKLRHWEFSVS